MEILLPSFLNVIWRKKMVRSFLKVKKQNSRSLSLTRSFKRVVASHTAIFREEEQRNVKAAKKKAAAAAEEAKPTLGDANEQLQALKDKMEAEKKK